MSLTHKTPDSTRARRLFIGPKLVVITLLLLLVAAQCQPDALPNASPTSQLPAPTFVLIPPIQPGDGTDLIDRLLETGVLRVGIRVWPEASYSPPAFRGFSNAKTGGALNGFEVDIARLVAEGMGLELELVEADPLLISSGNWRGHWDIALASLTPFDQPLEIALSQDVVYSRPYGYIPMGVLIPDTEDNAQTLEQLSGQRVGVLEHSAYQRLLTPEEGELTALGQPIMPKPPPDLQPVVLSNLLKAIRQLNQPNSKGSPQLDAIFGPTPILEAAIRSGLPVKLAPEAKNIGVQPLAIAMVPQDGLKVDRLVGEVDKILIQSHRQGALSEIYLRWYGQDLSQPP